MLGVAVTLMVMGAGIGLGASYGRRARGRRRSFVLLRERVGRPLSSVRGELALAGALDARAARRVRGWPPARAAAFGLGLATLAVALLAPDDRGLVAHMGQHLVLALAVAPLIVVGSPVALGLRATGARSRRPPRASWVAHPLLGWTALVAAMTVAPTCPSFLRRGRAPLPRCTSSSTSAPPRRGRPLLAARPRAPTPSRIAGAPRGACSTSSHAAGPMAVLGIALHAERAAVVRDVRRPARRSPTSTPPARSCGSAAGRRARCGPGRRRVVGGRPRTPPPPGVRASSGVTPCRVPLATSQGPRRRSRREASRPAPRARARRGLRRDGRVVRGGRGTGRAGGAPGAGGDAGARRPRPRPAREGVRELPRPGPPRFAGAGAVAASAPARPRSTSTSPRAACRSPTRPTSPSRTDPLYSPGATSTRSSPTSAPSATGVGPTPFPDPRRRRPGQGGLHRALRRLPPGRRAGRGSSPARSSRRSATSPPRQLAEAVRIGPYLMPRFGAPRAPRSTTLDRHRGVREVDAPTPTTAAAGGSGTSARCPRGSFPWLLAGAVLLGVVRLLGERSL